MSFAHTYQNSWTFSCVFASVIYEPYFDAWGKRRNANSWEYDTYVANPDFSWVRGFTGHEHHDEFGIINMNNRMYDPLIARMMGTDNYVQSPYFSQSYNRYSYVWNNPMSYTDPSGDIAIPLLVIGGAYLGGAIANNSFNPTEWDYGSAKTYLGIAAGATAFKWLPWVASKVNAVGFASGVFSGSLNMMYEYDKDNPKEQMIKDFSAGFLGGYASAVTCGACAMTIGGVANIVAGVGTYNDDYKGYQMAQRFVGGALVSYASVTLNSPSAGYINYKGNYLLGSKVFAKGLTYPMQNIAQRFAYTDRKYYLTGDPVESFFLNVMMPTFTGMVSGFAFGGISDIKKKSLVGERLLKFGLGMTVYSFDYFTSTMLSGYNPIEYKKFWQKAGIGSTKSLMFFLLRASKQKL
jgi:RHS repeat-associated protein